MDESPGASKPNLGPPSSHPQLVPSEGVQRPTPARLCFGLLIRVSKGSLRVPATDYPTTRRGGHDRDHARAPRSRRRPEGAVDDGAGDAEAGDRRRSPPTDGSEDAGASHPGGRGNPPPAR